MPSTSPLTETTQQNLRQPSSINTREPHELHNSRQNLNAFFIAGQLRKIYNEQHTNTAHKQQHKQQLITILLACQSLDTQHTTQMTDRNLSKDIAQIVYLLGKFASNEMLPKGNYVWLINLAKKLNTPNYAGTRSALEESDKPSQTIANTIQGMGYLANAGLLPKEEDYDWVVDLAKKFLTDPTLLAQSTIPRQELVTVLSALASFANKGLLPSRKDECWVGELAKKVLTLPIPPSSTDTPYTDIRAIRRAIGHFGENLLPSSIKNEILSSLPLTRSHHHFFNRPTMSKSTSHNQTPSMEA